MNYKAQRGTFDILPEEEGIWNKVQQTCFETARLFGYRYIETPIFEESGLFERTVGEDTDIVEKEMYSFDDKGGENGLHDRLDGKLQEHDEADLPDVLDELPPPQIVLEAAIDEAKVREDGPVAQAFCWNQPEQNIRVDAELQRKVDEHRERRPSDEHQVLAFETLFAAVKPGGTYIIEDIETSYWRHGTQIYGQTVTGDVNVVEALKSIADRVNNEYHRQGYPPFAGDVETVTS